MMVTLAEQAGIDTSVCEICEEPLDDSEPWKRGFDGCGAHLSCLYSNGIRLTDDELAQIKEKVAKGE